MTHDERSVLGLCAVGGAQRAAGAALPGPRGLPGLCTADRYRPEVWLFPGYAFVQIVAGWWHARRSAGVIRIILAGDAPAHVPARIIEDLRRREVRGLIELPEAPRFCPGDRVPITEGPLADRLGIFIGMKPRERVEVLLQLLGSLRQVELPKRDIERVPSG